MGILRDDKMHLASLVRVYSTTSTVMKIPVLSGLYSLDFQLKGNVRYTRLWTSLDGFCSSVSVSMKMSLVSDLYCLDYQVELYP